MSTMTHGTTRTRGGARVRRLALLGALLGLLAPAFITASPAYAAGTLSVTIEPVSVTTGAPQTWAGFDAGVITNLGYRVSYSCQSEACDGTKIQISPSQLDPTYDTHALLVWQSWTAPFVGATISGNNVTGKLINLGNLAAGDAGSFLLNYTWAYLTTPPPPASYWATGAQIVMSATASSTTAPTTPTVDAAPVEWRSTQPNPILAMGGTATSATGVDYTYTTTMSSACVTYRDTARKGDGRYTCAKSYVVTQDLPVQATFVSASDGGVYDAANHAVVWTSPAGFGSGEPTVGWGRVNASYNYYIPRTATVRFESEAFSPSGTDASYCDFTESVSSTIEMSMTYLGATASDDSRVTSSSSTVQTAVSCVSPFAKAIFLSKLSTFDGPSRYSGNVNSPVVIQPAPELNEHYWSLSVANQANVPGVAIIEENDVAIEGTRPYRIESTTSTGDIRPTDVIEWTLNTGATGTSNVGVVDAPPGTWFTAMRVTTAPLDGPNLFSTGNLRTVQNTVIRYRVTEDAPLNQMRTNTASATMTFPTTSLASLDLGTRSHSLTYLEPFGRVSILKESTSATLSGGDYYVTVPPTGSVNHNWRLTVSNTGNVPGVATITEADLGDKPVQVRSLTHQTSGNNVLTGATVNYTLNTGVSATAPMPFTAPAGTWITAFTVTSNVLEPANALPTQNNIGSFYRVFLNFAVPSTTVPGTWENTATTTVTYPGMGIAATAPVDVTRTMYLGEDSRPRITAAIVSGPVVTGGGNPLPGRDVTYEFRGSSSNVDPGATFLPQYVFIAPVNWNIKSGSASFPAGTVPSGVVFEYKTVTLSGIPRQVVIASWPSGTPSFGANAVWPTMRVIAQPSTSAASGTNGIAGVWVGESTNNWTTAQAVYTVAVADTVDMDGDSVVEGFASVNAPGVLVGLASQLAVLKEICLPNPASADDCDWVSTPGTVVGVDPAAGTIDYRVTITNSGNAPLTSLVGYDVLPFPGDSRGSTFGETIDSVANLVGATLAFSHSTNPCRLEVEPTGPAGCTDDWSSAPGADVDAQAVRLTATGSVAAGDSVSFRYTAAVAPGAAADAIACNSVAVKAAEIGVPTEPLAVCATTQEADLAVTVPERLPLQAGRDGVIPFTVTNHGGSQRSGAEVTVQLPAGFDLRTVGVDGWECTTPGGALSGPLAVTCVAVDTDGNVRLLELDTPDSLALAVRPTAIGSGVCIDAEVSGLMADPVLGNNTNSACFEVVAAAELGLAKTDGRTAVAIGDEVTYTLTVTNGLVGEAVPSVTLTDTLPAELEFVSASDGGTHSAGVVTWPVFDLDAAGTATVDGDDVDTAATAVTRTVTVRVLDTASGVITNTAAVSAVDPARADDEVSATASDVDGLLKLAVAKSSDAAPVGVREGDEVTYSVTVSNIGTGDYTAGTPAVLRDVLTGVLDDASFVAGSAEISIDGAPATSIGDPVGGVISWSGALDTGSEATLTYRVRVLGGGDLLLTNTAFTSATGASCDAVSGLDADGHACIVVTSPFAPEVSKSILSTTQNDDGTWTVVYAVDVVSLNATDPVEYDLQDELAFGSGISVVSASVTTSPAGVTPAAWAGSGAVVIAAELPAGDIHHYELTVVAQAGTVAGTAAATCVAGAMGGFANTVSLAPTGGDVQTAEACSSPSAPTVVKTASPTTQNVDGTWNVVYTITVSAPSGAPAAGLAYTLDDVLDFATGVTVVDAVVTAPTGATANAGFDGALDIALLDGTDRVLPGGTRVTTVAVTTEVSAGAVSTSDAACPPAGSGGYANAVGLYAGTSSTLLGGSTACTAVIAQPTPEVAKSVVQTSVDGVTGEWSIVYEVFVSNPSTEYSTVYSLDDALTFGTDIVIVDADITSADASPSAAWDGVGATMVVDDEALPAGGVHRYTVTVVASPPSVTDVNAPAMDCRLDVGETGTGFRNLASLTSGATTGFAVGCEAATDPSVVKTTVGSPTQNPATGHWSVEYLLTVSNRSTSTVTGGIPYTLEDTFDFPTGTTVYDVDVTEQLPGAGTSTVNTAFDGDGVTEVASGFIGAAASDTEPAQHLYTVVVVIGVPGGLTASAAQCDPAQGTGGLRNEAVISVGPRDTGDVTCVNAPEVPVAGVGKTVLSQVQNADGTWSIDYRVEVANPSLAAATIYTLEDEFALGAGITVVSAEIATSPTGVTVEPTWNGETATVVAEEILLAAGGTHTYTVRAVLDAGSVRQSDAAADCVQTPGETGTGFANVATVDSGAATRQDDACVRAWDPGVSKTVNGAPVANLDGSWTVRYVITVQNPSPTVTLAYGLDDELDFPASTVVNSAAASSRAGGPTTSMSWNGESDVVVVAAGAALPGGATHVFDIVVNATLPNGATSLVGGWANSAEVESGTGGVTSISPAAADIALPELTVTKTVDAPAVIAIGDTIEYTVTIANTGDGPYTSGFPAEVWDDLVGVLDDADLVSADATAGTVERIGNRLRWSGPLAVGATVDVTYVVAATAAGDLVLDNIAFAPALPGTTPTTPDLVDCTGIDCASTSTALPALQIVKTADVGVLKDGDSIVYTVTLRNTGSVDLPAATFSDDLADVVDDAVLTAGPTATTGTPTITGTTLTWTGALAAGDEVEVTYTMLVDDTLVGDDVLTNVATTDPRYGTAWPGGLCPGGVATCAPPERDATWVATVRDLAYAKVVDTINAAPGDTVRYTLTMENRGAVDFTAADPAILIDSLVDVLDDATYNADAVASAGVVTYAEPHLTWSSVLVAGAGESLTYSLRVLPLGSGDGVMRNVVGIGPGLPSLAIAACDANAASNGDASCYTVTNVVAMAHTGAAPSTPLLVAAAALLGSGVLLLLFFVLRRRDERDGPRHRAA